MQSQLTQSKETSLHGLNPHSLDRHAPHSHKPSQVSCLTQPRTAAVMTMQPAAVSFSTGSLNGSGIQRWDQAAVSYDSSPECQVNTEESPGVRLSLLNTQRWPHRVSPYLFANFRTNVLTYSTARHHWALRWENEQHHAGFVTQCYSNRPHCDLLTHSSFAQFLKHYSCSSLRVIRLL